jgi:Beta-propeller repeat.
MRLRIAILVLLWALIAENRSEAASYNITSTTRFGGTGIEAVTGVAVDSQGYVYIAGYTDSPNLPLVGAVRGYSGGVDGFIIKWNPVTRQTVFSTYLGGAGDDRVLSLAVGADGSVFVAGSTSSTNFPIVSGRQQYLAGGRDAFLTRLAPSGSSIIFSTYFGGTGTEAVNSIALTPQGDVWVVGETDSSNLPLWNPWQSSKRGGQDVLLAKFSATGTLILSSYFGGSGDDRALGAAVGLSGDLYFTGGTTSADLPLVNAYQKVNRGGQDAFVARFSASGSALIYSTYLGGQGGSAGFSEMGTGLAVDSSGAATVVGITSSPDFPLINAFQTVYGGGNTDSFIAKISPGGNSLLASSYFGGASIDEGKAVALRADGSVAFAGMSGSSNLVVKEAVQTSNRGFYDAFLVTLSADMRTVTSSSYLGGSGSDAAVGIGFTSSGSIYLAGTTSSVDFATSPFVQGLVDAFVTELTPANASMVPLTVASSPPGLQVTIGGAPACSPGTYAAPVTILVPGGTSCSLTAPGPQPAGTGARYLFSKWSTGASTPTISIVVPSGGGTYTALFQLQYQIQRAVSPAGSGTINITPSSADGYYAAGTPLTLSASPSPGFNFRAWNGLVSGAQNPVNIVVASPGTVGAEFSCPITITPSGLVSISSTLTKLTFSLSAGASCTWSASSDASWAQVFPLSGSGNATLEYTVYPNYSTVIREARLSAGSQVAVVRQAAATGNYNRRFSGQMYFSFFGRIPSNEEVDYMEAAVVNGLPLADLVMNFFNSEEFNIGGRFVAGLYVGLLGRDAEYGGWLFTRNALASSVVTHNDLVFNFLNSAEFQLKYGPLSDEDFIRLLYRNILLREATEEEVNFMLNALASGITRTQLATNFLNSNEFRLGVGPRLTAFILYACLLSRDPTSAEMEQRVAQIAGGMPVQTLVQEILQSSEFQDLLQ